MNTGSRVANDLNRKDLPHPVRRQVRAGAVPVLIGLLLAGCVTPDTAQESYEARISEVVRAAAVEAERSHNYENAVRQYQTLYERDANDPVTVRNLARNLRYAGSPQQAIAILEKALATVGRHPDLMLELAKAQIAASDLAGARETLDEAAISEALAENWQYHMVRGVYHDRVGKFPQAQEAYKRALALSPKNAVVMNNKALSHALSGHIDKGIALLKQLVDDETATPQTRQNLALLYGIRGDVNAAEELAKQDLPSAMAERNLGVYQDFRD